jgi:hypothetical protein
MSEAPSHVRLLRRLGACNEAQDFARLHPDATIAWRACQRGDWLLWYLARVTEPHSPERKLVVSLAADCAETAIGHIRDRGIREQVRYGLELLRRYTRGEGDLASAQLALRSAAAAADAAADAAAYAAAAAAAACAACAAYAAADAAYAAAYASDAADAATYAADAATYAAAYAAATRIRALARMADMMRVRFPVPPEVP